MPFSELSVSFLRRLPRLSLPLLFKSQLYFLKQMFYDNQKNA